jgi:hypothetical protein
MKKKLKKLPAPSEKGVSIYDKINATGKAAHILTIIILMAAAVVGSDN